MNHGMQLLLNARCLGRISRTLVPQCVQCRLKVTGGLCRTFGGTQTSRTLCYTSLLTERLTSKNTVTQCQIKQTCKARRGLSDNLNLAGFLGYSKASDWNKAVTEAEKIVGYPTSFMSLRCLLSDEFSNLAMHMRKLVGTKHPLLKTARRFVFDGTDSLQMRGLLVLLVAKAAGPSSRVASPNSDLLEPMVSGIYPSQRNLAEITEMIHTGHLVHMGVVNAADLLPTDGSPQDIHFGNKLAVLCGDFLLANASMAVARLYNTEVVELISTAIRDMMVAEFTQSNLQLPSSPLVGSTITAWEKQTFLATGSLLAKSCKGALILAKHGEEQQEAAFRLGTSMACAYQLHEGLRSVLNPDSNTCVTHLTSLPVALHLEDQPGDTDLLTGLVKTPSTKTQKRLVALLKSSGTIDRARNLIHTYQQEALQAVGVLGDNEARTAITNMVRAVTEV